DASEDSCWRSFDPGNFPNALADRFLGHAAIMRNACVKSDSAEVVGGARFPPPPVHSLGWRPSSLGVHYPWRSGTYSITSSATVSSTGGISRPSAFAVFRLITSSNLVGCSTGNSEGLVPLSI